MNSSDPTADQQRWRLDLAYDGAAFNGFAVQPHGPSVVAELKATLARTLGLAEEPQITGAARTDAGVHAFAQVIHVDLPTRTKVRSLDSERLMRSLNKQLRGKIQILRAEPVSQDFHARFSATWREYRYLVLESKEPGLALSNSWSWGVAGPLDIDLMNRAAADLVGTHDFRAFCRRPANSSPETPLLRKVLLVRWERVGDEWTMSAGENSVLRLTIRAQSFCHNMVRRVVSTMVGIGHGDFAVTTFKERLVSLDRHQLPTLAPASGLALVGVGYDDLSSPLAHS